MRQFTKNKSKSCKKNRNKKLNKNLQLVKNKNSYFHWKFLKTYPFVMKCRLQIIIIILTTLKIQIQGN